MAADGLFWVIAAAAAAVCLGVVFAPVLFRSVRAARRASYDLQVHRDQLREIDADVARGVLSQAEAAATRLEVSRRLLAAADAEAAERDAFAAPARLRWVAPVLIAALAAGGLGLYDWLGAPGVPDQPLAARQAQAAQEERLLAKLQAALADRPNDLEGHRLLARQLATLGRWPEALAAQERVVAILGDAVAPGDLVDLAEARIIAAGGVVGPEAQAEIGRALALDPADPAGRYYLALGQFQGGRPDLAFATWAALVADGPPDAPWMAPARAGMEAAARAAAQPPEPGPSTADAAAASAMPEADRQAMITGMVDQLAARLATAGGPPDDWAKLVRSLGVLGRRDEAATILAEARQAHAGDAAAQAALDAAAAAAGIAP